MPPSQKPSHPSFLLVHLAAAATGFPSSYSCCSLLSQFQSPMLLHLFSFHKKNQSNQHPTPYSSQITPLNFCPHIWSHPSPFPSTTPFPSSLSSVWSPPSEQVTSRQNKNTPSPTSSSSSPATLPTKPDSCVARALSLSLSRSSSSSSSSSSSAFFSSLPLYGLSETYELLA